ncbi:MAG: transketolase [Gemmatimonadetes bacterium]|nr:transketolase [Gemmatimonadota bacterium]
MRDLDELCVNTIRFLAVDAVEKAGSGHPGTPLGAAPMAYVLWDRFLRHDPADPNWPNRDRFILSAGHASALLYALLHLTGYDLPLDELKRFRQWGSKTPGHPEYGHTPGVEATTGPLGQGFAMGVGMALAERFHAQCFNRPGFPLVDHTTYAVVSDGDLMEGVSSEAASLAGTLGLGRLIYLYDDNHISIEGETDLAFTEDVRRRFEAYGWQVLRVADGNDLEGVAAALRAAREDAARPSLIIVRTHIGYGSPKEDTAAAHGEPLGPEASRVTKERFGWPVEPDFHIPEQARAHLRKAVERGRRWEGEWGELRARYREERPDLAECFQRQVQGELPDGWDAEIPRFSPEDGPMATRSASGKVLNALSERLPELIGGSADLAPSTKTLLLGYGDLGFDSDCARNIHFGVREHAMGAIVNGMALHGGVLPYGATFLVFSDYMRPPLRLAALMGVRAIFIFTHDSIALGEDGPTHQPVEQLASLRAIPDFRVLRPADANETAAAWRVAVESRKPVALVLTRQKVPVLDPDAYAIEDGVRKGAYVLAECEGKPDVILIATGSEVHLALGAKEKLDRLGTRARVVSMPSWDLFEEQPREVRERVLPSDVRARLAVEAAAPFGWRRWVGDAGEVIGVERFGASAPGTENLRRYGFTVDNVVERAQALAKGS